MSVVLDILSDIRNLMPTLRSIDKRVIKGMPFFTSTCALAQSLAQLDQIVSILSSSRITSSDAEFRVTEVANELIHLSKVFESWLSHFEDEDDDEIRRLILDSAHRMFPRIVTAVGEASFWLDESFSQRNLPQEVVI
ncbi:unnamed protein product, partial [Anisakis simplex]|uniref:Rx_N domain-containing protein n=1 Tax=Anisakis simplex TaxID=6269 RepID=A0A0M3JAT2_ANISI